MKGNYKNNFLKKKVLFSIIAAGMLSSFVLNAEAADPIIQSDGEGTGDNVDASWVWVERFQGKDSAALTLNGGNVAGSKLEETPFGSENHLSWYLIGTSYPKDSVDLAQAQVAVFVNKSCTTLNATNVNFTGEVAVRGYTGDPTQNDEREGIAKITIHGGRITAGKYYYSIPNSTEVRTEENATNILAYENGQIELNKVVISSNISAYSGGKIRVNNSSADDTGKISAANKIYAADTGSEIHIDFAATEANKKGTLNVGSEIFADKGATISINNANINVTKQDGLNKIGTIGATGENSLVELKNSNVVADNLAAKTGGKLTLDKSSSATVNSIRATVNESTDKIGGTIVIEGKFKTNDLSSSYKGEIYLQGGADAVYEVDRDVFISDGGKLYINSGKLKAETADTFKTSGTQYDKIFLEGTGIISTISKNIYTNEASAIQNNPGNLKNNGIVFTAGELILNDAQYTKVYAQAAQALLSQKGSTNLTMAGQQVDENGDAKDTMSTNDIDKAENSNINFNQTTVIATGNLLVGSTDDNLGHVIDGIQFLDAVENGFGAGFLDLGRVGANSLIITKNKELTLGGSLGGNLITVNGEDKDIKVIVGITKDTPTNKPLVGIDNYTGYHGTLNIGNALTTADTKYTLNGEVIVNKDSNLNVKGQTEITKGLTLNEGTVNVNMGFLKTKDLKITGDSNLLGQVSADTLDITANKKLFIGDATKAGKLTVNKVSLHGGMVFLDPAWKDGTTISDASGLAVKNITTADGAYVIGRNSVLALGTDLQAAEEKFAKTGESWGKDSISAATYIASPIDVASGSLTVDGALVDDASVATISPAVGSINFAAHSLLMVDAAKALAGPIITGVSTANINKNAKLYIDEAKKGETYHILSGTTTGWAEDSIISNNSLFKFTKANDSNGYTLTTSVKSMDEAFGTGQVPGSNAFDAALASQNDGDAAYDFIMAAADSRVNPGQAAQISALSSAAAMSELAGTAHGTYAVNHLLTDGVADHMSLASAKTHDQDLWAHYIHTKENVNGLAIANFGADYDAQYNGIIVGADLYQKGNTTFGAALTYLDGDISGHTVAAQTKNDATYYGMSLYGRITKGNGALIGDISYLHGKNDITQTNSGKTLTAKAKTDTYSIGLRAEKSFQVGKGKWVPYAGLRYMHLAAGDYTNSIGMHYDGNDMNLWMLPLGVTYSTEVKKGDWTLRPTAEIGYVWNLGDRDGTQTVSLYGASDSFGFAVADRGSYLGHLKIEAEKGNTTYGLGYEYQKGDTTKANRWMANVNWRF